MKKAFSSCGVSFPHGFRRESSELQIVDPRLKACGDDNRECTKRIRNTALLFLVLTTFSFFPGCGYTRHTVLPKNIKTIHIDTVKNALPINELYIYQPGLEVKITNAMINRLHHDGNLSVVPEEEADVILHSRLIAFQQGGVRFSNIEAVEEYRLFLVLDLALKDRRTGEVIWEEPNFSGDAEYFVSDIRSLGANEAAERAIDRLARNVVDRIVEDW